MLSYKIISSSRDNSVRLRIRNHGVKAEISLGIKMTEEELDNALSNSPRRDLLSSRTFLMSTLCKVDALRNTLILEDRSDISAPEFRNMAEDVLRGTNRKKKDSFAEFFKTCIARKTTPSTRYVYQYTYDRLCAYSEDFASGELDFGDITIGWLTDFECWLAQTMCKNARNIHLRNIRAVFNSAIDNEVTNHYPFRRFKIRPEATRKRALSVEDLRELFTCEVEEYAEYYRDMFKLIFMLIGINVKDLHNLKEITADGRIEYRRAKTHRPYSIKVEPEAMDLIERYRGEKGLLSIADRWSDHKNFTHQMNNALKRIGVVKRVGLGGKKVITPRWPNISSYWARHTWATIAWKIGIPKSVIAQALGHGGNSVTDIYIDYDNEQVDIANRKVLDYVLYNKA